MPFTALPQNFEGDCTASQNRKRQHPVGFPTLHKQSNIAGSGGRKHGNPPENVPPLRAVQDGGR
jgi:hypothetical protein